MTGPAITTRAAKGSPLTHAEFDANFTALRDAYGSVDVTGLTGDLTVSGSGVAQIAAGAVEDRHISATAAIAASKLAALSAGAVLMGAADGTPTATGISGELTLAATGSLDLAAGVVTASHIAADAAIAISKLAPMAAGSVVLGAADGTPTATAISGDITLAADGTASLAAGVITDSHIAAGAAIDSSKLAVISASGKVANSATTATSANTAEAIVARSATGNIDVTSINSGYLAGCRNILINGDLRINQRGVTIAAAATGSYGPDRWKKTGAATMTQIIEAGNYLPGATYTLSGTGVTEQQLTAPSSGNWTLPNISTTATNIQLELGTVATPFELRPLALEHLLCRRYYVKYSEYAVGCGRQLRRLSPQKSSSLIAAVTFSVPMRVAPVVTYTTPSIQNGSGFSWAANSLGATATVASSVLDPMWIWDLTTEFSAEL